MSENDILPSVSEHPPRAPVPRWRTPALTFAGFTALVLFFATSSAGLVGASIQWYLWGTLVWPIVALDRRLPVARERLWPRVLWHVPLGVAWTIVYIFLSREIGSLVYGVPLRAMVSAETIKMAMVGAFHWNLVVYAVIVGGHWALDYHRRWREHQERAVTLERLLTEARLGALQAQLRPHFLFNGLNTISAYVEHEPRIARRMLGHLGDLLRWSLEDGDSQEVPLANELALLNHYLAIQRVRFQDRLTIDFDVEPSTLRALVPGLLLQPLVENAIRHGIAPRAAPGRVLVGARREARRDGGRLLLHVEDDGLGLRDGWDVTRDAGVGLDNTRRRLAALYGDAQMFTVRPGPSGGVRVEVVVPLREAISGNGHQLFAADARSSGESRDSLASLASPEWTESRESKESSHVESGRSSGPAGSDRR